MISRKTEDATFAMPHCMEADSYAMGGVLKRSGEMCLRQLNNLSDC